MHTEQLFESTTTLTVERIRRSDKDALQSACDLINAGSQLSWELTPQRLLRKLGSNGRFFALFDDEMVVGCIGIKERSDVDPELVVGEIGYLVVDPEYRSLQAVKKLYDIALRKSDNFDMVFGTTNSKNRAVNTLLKRSNDMEFVFSAKSPYSSNILNYWLADIPSMIPKESQEEILRAKFS